MRGTVRYDERGSTLGTDPTHSVTVEVIRWEHVGVTLRAGLRHYSIT